MLVYYSNSGEWNRYLEYLWIWYAFMFIKFEKKYFWHVFNIYKLILYTNSGIIKICTIKNIYLNSSSRYSIIEFTAI